MINHADIENIIGCKTLVTDRMQRAIEDWYDAAINGLPLDKNPETLTLDLPALICAELARLTTLELEATVEGSDRADWINTRLQRVLTPRKRRIFTVALALGSGIWKPYQSGNKLGISFANATRYFPVAHDVEGSLTEGVFIDTIVICSCTAMIMLTAPENIVAGKEGMDLLQSAMRYHLGEFGVIFIAVTLFLFSFSTFLGILFYARSNVAYLFGDKWIFQTLYKILALVMLFIGGIAAYTFVWDLGDVGIGLMTIFNTGILYLLGGQALSALKEFESTK